ncbi:protrudin-like isoform X2 [Clytia hemisphaerica]|uniref:protrudin-like isoform X2 n=1 Tax=Clytia hemisphaerica TaxID=252671 RepID=UPI0034D60222
MSVLINDGNAENEDIVKCDIGELVLSVELLKNQVSPFIRIFNNTRSILRWERPLRTISVMLFLLYVVILNPLYIMLLVLTSILPMMVYGLVQCLGKAKRPNKRYKDFFIKKGDDYYQDVLTQEERRKHLNMYLNMLVQTQKGCNELNKRFHQFYSIIFWHEKTRSLKYFMMFTALVVLFYTSSMSHALFINILLLFLYNKYLYKETMNTLYRMKASIMNLFTLKSHSKKKESASEHTTDVGLETIDSSERSKEVEGGDSSASTSSESESDESETEDGNDMKISQSDAQKNMADNGSMMSKFFSTRSWRKRTTALYIRS